MLSLSSLRASTIASYPLYSDPLMAYIMCYDNKTIPNIHSFSYESLQNFLNIQSLLFFVDDYGLTIFQIISILINFNSSLTLILFVRNTF